MRQILTIKMYSTHSTLDSWLGGLSLPNLVLDDDFDEYIYIPSHCPSQSSRILLQRLGFRSVIFVRFSSTIHIYALLILNSFHTKEFTI